jgi:hypothetical protein
MHLSCLCVPAAGMVGSYRTIKATWGPIALQAQLQRQQREQCHHQQQQLADPAGSTAVAAAAGASGGGSASSSGAVAAAAAGLQPGQDCLDAVGLQDVVLAAVGFVEAHATARAGGASAQVRCEAIIMLNMLAACEDSGSSVQAPCVFLHPVQYLCYCWVCIFLLCCLLCLVCLPYRLLGLHQLEVSASLLPLCSILRLLVPGCTCAVSCAKVCLQHVQQRTVQQMQHASS